MKTLIIILTITIPTLCYSQWNGIYFHADQESAIAVLNKDTIVAVANEGGRIHRSTDGGQNWSFYQTIFTEGYLDVDFPTNLVGYACGGSAFGPHREFIVKTIDGGQTWDSLISEANGNPFFYYYTKIRFLNADTGFVAPMVGSLYKTTNGGSTFTQLPLIHPQMLSANEITIKPNQEIFAALKLTQGPGITSYSMFRSTDLGLSWTSVYTGDNKSINKIFFVDNTTGYAVGGGGLFLKTIDGGATWTSSFINPYTNLTGLHFVSPDVGYINNAGGIYRTEDGGGNWAVQNISPLTIIHQIKFANDTIGYALGDNGVYKTTNGGHILSVDEISSMLNFTIYPNPTKSSFTIDMSNLSKYKNVVIKDIFGKEIYNTIVPDEKINIDLKTNRGLYFVNIITPTGKSKTLKLVVE